MANSKNLNWFTAYQNFLAEADPTKLRELLEPLEVAIIERHLELNGNAGDEEERLALKTATNKLLEVKISKLGFPGWDGDGISARVR